MLSFAITDFGDTFIKAMNQDAVSFKSQFILESLVKKDPGFTYNLAHDNNNKVTGIVWMTSYIRDNLKDLVIIYQLMLCTHQYVIPRNFVT